MIHGLPVASYDAEFIQGDLDDMMGAIPGGWGPGQLVSSPFQFYRRDVHPLSFLLVVNGQGQVKPQHFKPRKLGADKIRSARSRLSCSTPSNGNCNNNA